MGWKFSSNEHPEFIKGDGINSKIAIWYKKKETRNGRPKWKVFYASTLFLQAQELDIVD